MKFANFTGYENNLDKCDIGHCQIKIKVTVGLKRFPPFTMIQIVRSHNLALVQAKKFILSMYIYFCDNSLQNSRIPHNGTLEEIKNR